MRKGWLVLTVLAIVATACASSTTTSSAAGSTSASTAAACAQAATFVTDGTLTVGTDNPAYPPYFGGGTPSGSDWKINDPSTGKGFESAVAYEIAKRMGFSSSDVTWVVVPFTQSYAPG